VQAHGNRGDLLNLSPCTPSFNPPPQQSGGGILFCPSSSLEPGGIDFFASPRRFHGKELIFCPCFNGIDLIFCLSYFLAGGYAFFCSSPIRLWGRIQEGCCGSSAPKDHLPAKVTLARRISGMDKFKVVF
jgi:hypothetical protein